VPYGRGGSSPLAGMSAAGLAQPGGQAQLPTVLPYLTLWGIVLEWDEFFAEVSVGRPTFPTVEQTSNSHRSRSALSSPVNTANRQVGAAQCANVQFLG
jgi:hypothetical protein